MINGLDIYYSKNVGRGMKPIANKQKANGLKPVANKQKANGLNPFQKEKDVKKYMGKD